MGAADTDSKGLTHISSAWLAQAQQLRAVAPYLHKPLVRELVLALAQSCEQLGSAAAASAKEPSDQVGDNRVPLDTIFVKKKEMVVPRC